MPTLADIEKRMCELEPSLGRVYPIASLGATTLVVTALATGSVLSGKGIGKFLLRWECADEADRVRIASNFASATGTYTHAGANYADTTATDETVGVLEYDPYDIDRAVVQAMETTRFLDQAILPVNGSGIYWLDEYDWITEPSVIREVRYDSMPVLTNNRFMQQWNGYSAAGALVPDYWTLSGTFTRGTGAKRGKHTLVSPDNAWSVSQEVGLLEVDVSSSGLRGQTVTAVLVGSSATASQATVKVDDGDTSSTSSTALASTRGEVTVQHTISDDATKLTLSAQGTNTTTIEELYLCFGTVTDAVRVGIPHVKRVWPGWTLDWHQGQPLRMDSTVMLGRGTRLVLVTERPYEPFVASRIQAGTADADETDAPLDLIAQAALAKFYEYRADATDRTAEDISKALKWAKRADQAKALHLASSDNPGINDTILSSRGSRVMARGVR